MISASVSNIDEEVSDNEGDEEDTDETNGEEEEQQNDVTPNIGTDILLFCRIELTK